jgi:hypothetical protein
MKRKRIFGSLLAALLLLALVPGCENIANGPADPRQTGDPARPESETPSQESTTPADKVFTAASEAELAEAFAWLAANAVENGSYAIEIAADLSQEAKVLDKAAFNKQKTVSLTLRGKDGPRTIQLSGNGSIYEIRDGIKLVLENIALQGVAENDSPLVTVRTKSGLVMKTGSKITGNTFFRYRTEGYGGGGVYMMGGTFVMEDGEISGNTLGSKEILTKNLYGGGVYITAGTFTMEGGKISNNRVLAESRVFGGGAAVMGAAFIMNGGEISYNSTDAYINNGGGVVLSDGATLTLKDGKISHNTAGNCGGVSLHGGIFGMKAGGVLIMEGGEISHNTAAGSAGGVGIIEGERAQNPATFIMRSGKITENTVRIVSNSAWTYAYGGGVYNQAVFVMEGGEISGNKVESVSSYGGSFAYGGGVFSSSSFTMKDGLISGNSVTGNSGIGGGGIMINLPFTMEGGEISGNVLIPQSSETTEVGGAGVYFSRAFTKTGNSVIYGNDAGDKSNTVQGEAPGSGYAVFNNKTKEVRDSTIALGEDFSANLE